MRPSRFPRNGTRACRIAKRCACRIRAGRVGGVCASAERVSRVPRVMRPARKTRPKSSGRTGDPRAPGTKRLLPPEDREDREERVRRSIDKVLTEHSDLMAKLAK